MTAYGFKNKLDQLQGTAARKKKQEPTKAYNAQYATNLIMGLTSTQSQVFYSILDKFAASHFRSFVVTLNSFARDQLRKKTHAELNARLKEACKVGNVAEMINALVHKDALSHFDDTQHQLLTALLIHLKRPEHFTRLKNACGGIAKLPAVRMLVPVERKNSNFVGMFSQEQLSTTHQRSIENLLYWVARSDLEKIDYVTYTQSAVLLGTPLTKPMMHSADFLTLTQAGLNDILSKGYHHALFSPAINKLIDLTTFSPFMVLCGLVGAHGNTALKQSFNHFVTVFDAVKIRIVLEQCDFQYYDAHLANATDVGLINALIKMGAKPEMLFVWLTRKECYDYLEFVKAEGRFSQEIFFHGIQHLYLAKKFFKAKNWGQVNDRYVRALGQYSVSRNTFMWGLHHVEQLGRRTTLNANGHIYQTDLFHILGDINDEDLTQGMRTSFYKIKRLSQRRRYAAELPSENVELPKFPLPITDTRIVQITTSEGLLDESVKMHHCVATYYKKCMEQKCYIFHVDDGSPYGVTIEVSPPTKPRFLFGGLGKPITVNNQITYHIAQCQSYLSDNVQQARSIMQKALDRLNILGKFNQTEIDCDTTTGVQISITTANDVDRLVGRYVKLSSQDQNWTFISTAEQAAEYLGQTLLLRSAVNCMAPSTMICTHCTGIKPTPTN